MGNYPALSRTCHTAKTVTVQLVERLKKEWWTCRQAIRFAVTLFTTCRKTQVFISRVKKVWPQEGVDRTNQPNLPTLWRNGYRGRSCSTSCRLTALLLFADIMLCGEKLVTILHEVGKRCWHGHSRNKTVSMTTDEGTNVDRALCTTCSGFLNMLHKNITTFVPSSPYTLLIYSIFCYFLL